MESFHDQTGWFSCILQSTSAHIFEGAEGGWAELTYPKFLHLRPKLHQRKYILHGMLCCERGRGEDANHNSGRHCQVMQKSYLTLKGAKAMYFDLPQRTFIKHFVSGKKMVKCRLQNTNSNAKPFSSNMNSLLCRNSGFWSGATVTIDDQFEILHCDNRCFSLSAANYSLFYKQEQTHFWGHLF